MRARYSAYALGDVPYLLATWHPSTRPSRLVHDPGRTWTRLEVVSRSGGGLFDAEGRVGFRAHSERRGRADVLAEDSRFVREAGRWLYVEGTRLVPPGSLGRTRATGLRSAGPSPSTGPT